MRGYHLLILLVPFIMVSIHHIKSVNTYDTACNGTIDYYKYDLEELSNVTSGENSQIKDSRGNIFFYRPCYELLNEYCKTLTDYHPAVCQRDTRKIPQFHDCGSTSYVKWSKRVEGPDTGFIIKFSGGELNRTSNIEFICDKTIGIGNLEIASPEEEPRYFYHFKWRTSYACPI